MAHNQSGKKNRKVTKSCGKTGKSALEKAEEEHRRKKAEIESGETFRSQKPTGRQPSPSSNRSRYY